MSLEDENEDEWEEQYVFVELIGMVDPDKLSFCTQENTAILGIEDDDMTIIKLGGYAFSGTYEDAVGSMVLFEEKDGKDSKTLKYRCHTTKVLKASRVFLKHKPTDKIDENGDVENGATSSGHNESKEKRNNIDKSS